MQADQFERAPVYGRVIPHLLMSQMGQLTIHGPLVMWRAVSGLSCPLLTRWAVSGLSCPLLTQRVVSGLSESLADAAGCERLIESLADAAGCVRPGNRPQLSFVGMLSSARPQRGPTSQPGVAQRTPGHLSGVSVFADDRSSLDVSISCS